MSGQKQPQTQKQIREIRIVDLVTYTLLPRALGLGLVVLFGLGFQNPARLGDLRNPWRGDVFSFEKVCDRLGVGI